VMIGQINLFQTRSHGLDQADGKFQFVFVDFLALDLWNVRHASEFTRMTKLVENKAAVLRGDHHDLFAVAKNDFADADFAACFERLAEKRISLGCDGTIGTSKVRRIVKGGSDFVPIDEPRDLNH